MSDQTPNNNTKDNGCTLATAWSGKMVAKVLRHSGRLIKADDILQVREIVSTSKELSTDQGCLLTLIFMIHHDVLDEVNIIAKQLLD